MRAEFTIPGEPCGKGRPRFTKAGHTYTPQKTAVYENLVKLEYERQCSGIRFDEGAVGIKITAYFAVPKSVSQKKKAEMISGNVFPTKKPDADNILKIVADALNGIAYGDDKQVVTAQVQKQYAEQAHTKVEIWRYGDE